MGAVLLSPLAQIYYESSEGMGAGFWIFFAVIFLIAIATYIFTAYCLMKMAEKLQVPNGWFAFIPFLNIWLVVQMGRKETSWFIIMLIFNFCFPIVTMVMAILILMDVSEMLGFERFWGILVIIPIFNLYVFYKWAFTTA